MEEMEKMRSELKEAQEIIEKIEKTLETPFGLGVEARKKYRALQEMYRNKARDLKGRIVLMETQREMEAGRIDPDRPPKHFQDRK